MARHSENYNLRVRDEEGRTIKELLVANVGKVDPKRHLVSNAGRAHVRMTLNIGTWCR